MRGGQTVQGHRAEPVALAQPQYTEFRLAESGGVIQHDLEHRLQLAGRARDDAQHFGRRRLLLPHLGEFLFQIGAGLADAANARSRLRSGRTRLAVACWAFCAFERQGHPVGTATGPPSGRPSQGPSLAILTEPHDGRVPLHSITSSARPSRGSGTVSPSVLTVLRLMTNSTFTAF